MSVSVSTTAGNQVTVTVDGATQLSFTTEESSISVVNGDTSSISVTNQGPKGDTGATGAQGPQGETGQGVPAGGTQFQVLRKVDGDDYNTEWDYADRVTIEVRFDEDVSKGDPLYITGYNNGQNRITVAKADASDSAKMPSIGLAFSDYSQNDNGKVTSIGSLEDIDTQVDNDFQEGDVVYVASGGGLTNVKPTGTNLIQNVGKVGRRQQNNGEIIVMAIGRSNDVPNIPNGQAWIGNASGVATPTTLATVATSGSYNDLSDQPTIPTNTNIYDTDGVLTGDRTVDLRSYDLTFDGAGGVAKIFSSGYIKATGRSLIDGNGVIGGRLTLNDADNSNSVSLISPTSVASDVTFTLPDEDGSAGQVIKTDGSGVLSFGDSVTEVSGDTTPQLGGDLDVNGNKITSASNGDVTIDPDGTGSISLASDSITLSGASIFPGSIKFQESSYYGTNTLKIQGPLSLASDITLNLPSSLGSSGQVLQTDGSGFLSWGDKSTTIPFGNISGRWQWSGTSDGLRVFTGSSVYGPFNYYFHSSIPSASYAALRTYSGSEVEDSTSVSVPSYFMIAYGVRLPSVGRVKVDFSLRFSSSTTPDASTPFGVSLWTCAGPLSTADSASRTLTFRKASADLLYSTPVTHHNGSITTNGNIGDDYAFIMVEHRNSTGLNNTTYGYGNMSLSIVP